MKKNIITTILLLIYTVTFIVLFIKLRSMSSAVLEELAVNNIYYILGFMFLAGISVSFYLIIDGTNKDQTLMIEKESENFTFQDNSESIQSSSEISSIKDIEKIKLELSNLLERKDNTEKERLDNMIWKICNHFQISQALLYVKENDRGQLTMKASYAFIAPENEPRYIISGEGLTGQAVVDGTPYFIKDVPEGYMKVISGLGESLPKSLLIIPCKTENEVTSVFELSSLQEYSKETFDEIVSVCKYVSNILTK